jgi:Cd2+/Zn2+-exporting ATPase
MTIKEYSIHNLTCANCGNKIESEIKALPEVDEASLDIMNSRLVVQYHANIDNALERLNKLAASIEPGVSFSDGDAKEHKDTNLWMFMPVITGVLLAAGLMLWETSAQLETIVGISAWLLSGGKVLWTAVRSIGRGQLFNEQFLMALATAGAVYLGEFTEAVAVMALYELGQYLEDKAVDRSRGSIRNLLALKPDKAHLISPYGIKDVKLSEINKGDILQVFPGERVPLDGIVLEGTGTLDTSSLTGESEPLLANPGDSLFAGFMNGESLLEIKSTATEAESTVSRILKLIENAGQKKSSQEKFISRFARYYTPAVVMAALMVFAIPTLMGYDAAIWFKRALVFLIVSCPCALVISIPLTYFVSIGIAARRGIIVKGSVYLDVLRSVKTAVFDKTGTLTTGDLRIERILAEGDTTPDDLMRTLCLCERTSNHPFAKAIKTACSVDYSGSEVNAYSEYPGKGVLLLYGEDRLIAGSTIFLKEMGFIDLIDTDGQSSVHAARNDTYLGCVTFSDEVKPAMKPALANIRNLGVASLQMLSGDREVKARAVCDDLGLDACHAELLPQQKTETLERIMASNHGPVAFIGDGMNDAPSLARSDVGIAMGSIGNPASIETADIVLLNDRPQQLESVFRLAKLTGSTVKQNVAFALGVKALVMALGITGISGLWEAIIADVGVTLLVIFNSLRMARGQRTA